MLPADKAQKKEKILQMMRVGPVDDKTLQEFMAINEEEKQWEADRANALSSIAENVRKFNIDLSMLLAHQDELGPLFNKQQCTAAIESLEAKAAAASTPSKSSPSKNKKEHRPDDELLFSVRGAAGPHLRIWQGDPLPVKFPASFKSAFSGSNKQQIHDTLVEKFKAENISTSAQAYLKSVDGQQQVDTLVNYIAAELAKLGGPDSTSA